MTAPTIKQKSLFIEREGSPRIEVRRLRWKTAREFFRKFASIVADAYKGESADATLMQMLLSKLPSVVAGSDELATLLVTGSTDLTADALDALDQVTALAVIDAALAVNVDEETKNFWAGIGAKIADLLPAKAPVPMTT